MVNKKTMLNMDFLFEKTVDKSVLKEGLSVPTEVQSVLYEKLGRRVDFGEAVPIKLLIENEIYDASLKNQRYSKENHPNHADLVQIRYKGDTAMALRAIFYATQNFINTVEQDKQGTALIKIPDELKEYIKIHTVGEPDKLLFECIPLAQEKEAEIVKELDDERLKEAAHRRSGIIKKPVEKTVVTNYRDTYISEYAKRRAGGKCQLCLKEAPFVNREGQPYLESHHIQWLSKGGLDTVENIVALCPNCHRKMHVVNDERDVEKLKQAIQGGTIE